MSRLMVVIFVLLTPFLNSCVVIKVAATPLAVARDIVDCPLAIITTATMNVFNKESSKSDEWKAGEEEEYCRRQKNAGTHNVSRQQSIDICYLPGYFFMFLTFTIGGTDYVLCRSLVPFPKGSCPWKERRKTFWSDFLFPNTRTLWSVAKKSSPKLPRTITPDHQKKDDNFDVEPKKDFRTQYEELIQELNQKHSK